MRDITEIEVNGIAVQVHEMTVTEVMTWLQDAKVAASGDINPIDELLLDGCSLSDLARMTDISVEDMRGLTPSELDQVLEVAKARNPAFFRVRGLLWTEAAPIPRAA